VTKKDLERKSIKNWVPEERPREMLYAKGSKALSLAKLLAIILRTGDEKQNAEELARSLLNQYGTLRALYDAPMEQLCNIRGVGLAKAAQIKAALELGLRLTQEHTKAVKKLKTHKDIINYVSASMGDELGNSTKEYFKVVLLDAKNKPIRTIDLSSGGRNASIVEIPEIIKQASIHSAVNIILVHNHPSGDTAPSPEDIYLTTRIKQACQLVGIGLVDHVIVGKAGRQGYSFKQSEQI